MKRRPRVLVTTSSFADWDDKPLRLLEDAGLEVQLNPYGRKLTPDECTTLFRDMDGLVAGTEALTAEILKSAERLKVISRCGVGTDNIDMEVARELGIEVLTTGDAHVQAVAELTLGLMLDLLRRVSTQDRLVRSGVWKKSMGSLLSGKTLGILGLGRVGRRVVELTAPFDLRYVAWDVSPDQQFAEKWGVAFVELDELLMESDIVTLHLPYASELKGFIAERELGLMKSDALLVNTARGALVDEVALHAALEEEAISGAALDVFDQEPYTGRLGELDSVILTPHIGSYARETRLEMEIQAAKNLLQGLRDRHD